MDRHPTYIIDKGFIYRVSQKKGSCRFKAHLKALNGLKSKVEENIPTPIKIQCQLLEGVLKAQKWGFCFLPFFDLSPFKSSK